MQRAVYTRGRHIHVPSQFMNRQGVYRSIFHKVLLKNLYLKNGLIKTHTVLYFCSFIIVNLHFHRSNEENSFYATFQISSSLIFTHIILTLVPYSTNILWWVCFMEPQIIFYYYFKVTTHFILMIILFSFNNFAINECVFIFSLSFFPLYFSCTTYQSTLIQCTAPSLFNI